MLGRSVLLLLFASLIAASDSAQNRDLDVSANKFVQKVVSCLWDLRIVNHGYDPSSHAHCCCVYGGLPLMLSKNSLTYMANHMALLVTRPEDLERHGCEFYRSCERNEISDENIVDFCTAHCMLVGPMADGAMEKLLSMTKDGLVWEFVKDMNASDSREYCETIFKHSDSRFGATIRETVEIVFKLQPKIAGDIICAIVAEQKNQGLLNEVVQYVFPRYFGDSEVNSNDLKGSPFSDAQLYSDTLPSLEVNKLKWWLDRLDPELLKLAGQYLSDFIPNDFTFGSVVRRAGAWVGFRSNPHDQVLHKKPLTSTEFDIQSYAHGFPFAKPSNQTLFSVVNKIINDSSLSQRGRLFYFNSYLELVFSNKLLLIRGFTFDFAAAYSKRYQELCGCCDHRLVLLVPEWMKPEQYDRVVVALTMEKALPLLPESYIREKLKNADVILVKGTEASKEALFICWFVAAQVYRNWDCKLTNTLYRYGIEMPEDAARELQLLNESPTRELPSIYGDLAKSLESQSKRALHTIFGSTLRWLIEFLLSVNHNEEVLREVTLGFKLECVALIDFMLDNYEEYNLVQFEKVAYILYTLGIESEDSLSERLFYRRILHEPSNAVDE